MMMCSTEVLILIIQKKMAQLVRVLVVKKMFTE